MNEANQNIEKSMKDYLSSTERFSARMKASFNKNSGADGEEPLIG